MQVRCRGAQQPACETHADWLSGYPEAFRVNGGRVIPGHDFRVSFLNGRATQFNKASSIRSKTNGRLPASL